VRIPLSRTGAAILLAGAAALVPCTAWYIAGSRAAEQRAAEIENEPLYRAQASADRMARQISLRMTALLETESKRAITDYGVDPGSLGSTCKPPELSSPLAEGPADPLIWTHFQVDSVGQLTLPSLSTNNDTGSMENRAVTLAGQLKIFDEMECVKSDHLDSLRRVLLGSMPRQLDTLPGPVSVGAFSWHTLTLQEQPALVALRDVTTPAAVLTQGFVVLASELEQMLDSSLSTRVGPGEPVAQGQALIPLEGDAWHVEVGAGEALAVARGEAAAIRARFLRTFLLVASAAVLAGLLMVLLVRQTERLAGQRARFAAAAAHELRTPLAGLRLYGEMLADGSGDPQRSRTYARRVADEAERLGRVVSNVLGYSKLEHGKLRLALVRGDLAGATRESIEQLTPALEAQGAHVATRIADDLPAVRFDRDAVHQMLQNLLDNAEKYTRNATDRTIQVHLGAENGEARLAVVDHGSGVAAGIRRSMFDPFVRDPSPDAPAGLGIGLALVHALAQAHSARMAHAEADGGGAEFSIYFPAA